MNKASALIVEIQSALDELMELVNEAPAAQSQYVRRIQHIHTGEWVMSIANPMGVVWTTVKNSAYKYETWGFAELKKILLDKGYVVGQDVRIMRSKK